MKYLRDAIITIAPQRSGTTVFQLTLAKEMKIAYYGEVFHHDNKPDSNFFSFLESNSEYIKKKIYPSYENMAFLFEEYFKKLSALSNNSKYLIDIKQNSLHHFDTIWEEQGEPPCLLRLLMKNEATIVRIKRNNLFEQVLSCLLARKIGQNHFSQNETLPEISPFSISPIQIQNLISRIEKSNIIVDNYIKPYKKAYFITYEEMFEGQFFSRSLQNLVNSMLGYTINLNDKPALKKISDKNYRYIENKDEIYRYFKNTPYQNLVRKSFHKSVNKKNSFFRFFSS